MSDTVQMVIDFSPAILCLAAWLVLDAKEKSRNAEEMTEAESRIAKLERRMSSLVPSEEEKT